MQLGGQGFGVGVVGVIGRVGVALDGVLDLADDALAGSGAVVGRVLGGWGRLGDAAGEHDAAADGAGDAVEGGREVLQRGRGGVGGGGPVRGGGLCGLGGGLGVQEACEVGAHVDGVVQDVAVVLGVLGLLAGAGVGLGVCCVCGHEQKKNIIGDGGSRVVWVGKVTNWTLKSARTT